MLVGGPGSNTFQEIDSPNVTQRSGEVLFFAKTHIAFFGVVRSDNEARQDARAISLKMVE